MSYIYIKYIRKEKLRNLVGFVTILNKLKRVRYEIKLSNSYPTKVVSRTRFSIPNKTSPKSLRCVKRRALLLLKQVQHDDMGGVEKSLMG